MKKILSGLAILFLIAMVFTGCGDKATIFVGQDGSLTNSIIFNNDGTWVCHIKGTNQGISFDLDEATGTYTGNPKEDGTITIKVTKMVDISSLLGAALVAYFSNGQTSITITNEQAPLQTIPEDEQTTQTITISGGKFTSNGTVYTRR